MSCLYLPGISCCIETSWIQEGNLFHTDAPWSDQIRVFHTKKQNNTNPIISIFSPPRLCTLPACNPCQTRRIWSYPGAECGWRISWKMTSLSHIDIDDHDLRHIPLDFLRGKYQGCAPVLSVHINWKRIFSWI